MKFGKTIQREAKGLPERYQSFVIDYKGMKIALKALCNTIGTDAFAKQDEEFLALYWKQVEKAEQGINRARKSLESKRAELEPVSSPLIL